MTFLRTKQNFTPYCKMNRKELEGFKKKKKSQKKSKVDFKISKFSSIRIKKNK